MNQKKHTGMSRRDFLKASGITAAGLSVMASGVLPGVMPLVGGKSSDKTLSDKTVSTKDLVATAPVK